MTIETMTTAEAADALGVHVVTLRKWRSKSSEFFGVMEDCQGLTWWYQNPRKIVYCTVGVHRLKRILNRRKTNNGSRINRQVST